MSSCNSCGSMRYSCSCKQSSFSTYFPSNKYFYNKKEIDNMLKGLNGSGGSGGSVVVKHYVPYGTTELFKTLDQAKASVTAINGDYLITYDVDNAKGQLWLRVNNAWQLVNDNVGNVVMSDYVRKVDYDLKDVIFTSTPASAVVTSPIDVTGKLAEVVVDLQYNLKNTGDVDTQAIFIADNLKREQRLLTKDSDVTIKVELEVSGNSVTGVKVSFEDISRGTKVIEAHSDIINKIYTREVK